MVITIGSKQNKMKIGILTFHYTSNQGSVMQAFSLYHYLKENYPAHEVQIIDLIPITRELYELIFAKKKFPFIDIHKFIKYIRLRSFVKQNFNRTQRVYYGKLKNQVDFINRQNYDLVITGSDTVWFKSIKLRNQIPNIYFLPNEIRAKKISYAASVDPLNDEKIYFNNKEILKNIFQSYELITVRDKVTNQLLSKLGIESQMVIDPTLLYDFEKKLNLKVNNKGKKIIKTIGIGIIDKTLSLRIKNILSKSGKYQIVDFFETRSLITDFLLDELNKYFVLDALITDRFHRAIFSLKLSRSLTIYIENGKFNKMANSKGRDLLTKIGIDDSIIRSDLSDFEFKLNTCLQSWTLYKQSEQNQKFEKFLKQNQSTVKILFDQILL